MLTIAQRTGQDSLDVLSAGQAEATAPAAVARQDDRPKFFWLELNGTSGVSWSIDVARPGGFRVEALVRAPGATASLHLDGVAVVEVATTLDGWECVAMGMVHIADGSHTLELRIVGGPGEEGFAVRSLELLHEDEVSGYGDRLATFRKASDGTALRWRQSPLGIMVQYGPWSYGRSGSHLPDLQEHVDAFDVDAFADRVHQLGAGYVVWSLSWWTFALAAPSRTVDAVVGHSELTADRDLIGELAAACRRRGMMFFLYFHPGHDAHRGYNSTPWWRAQHWPDEFTSTGGGDRRAMFSNLGALFTELGHRYGAGLDGWMLDDGMIYYPAPFEHLSECLRAGNPERLVSYNAWILPRVTRFQDIDFGEGRRTVDDLDLDADGRLTSGPHAGLRPHVMTPLQPEWGIHSPDQRHDLDEWSDAGLDGLLAQAGRVRIPVTIDLLMWHPGSFDPAAEARLERLTARRASTPGRAR